MVKLLLICLVSFIAACYAQNQAVVIFSKYLSKYITATGENKPLTFDETTDTQTKGFYMTGPKDARVFESVKYPGQYISCPQDECQLSSTQETFLQTVGLYDNVFFETSQFKIMTGTIEGVFLEPLDGAPDFRQAFFLDPFKMS